VVLAGEVKSNAYLDVQDIAREVIRKIGYTKSEYMFEANSCGILSAIHEQSADINQGVERKKKEDQGAGDQGMMFGYANNETDNRMPLAISIAHLLLEELANIRREGKKMKYLRPDAKSQVTIEYSDDHKALRVDTIVLSTQHDDWVKPKTGKASDAKKADDHMLSEISDDVKTVLIPRVLKRLPKRVQNLFGSDIKYHINPTGKFVIGGPHGDTGLTGRKIIVDTYGGKGAHGGGAFSGKDPSKVDRSAAYATRHIARNLVASGVCEEVLVQVSYAIGVADPVGLFVDTYGTAKVKMSDGEIAATILKMKEFSLRPYDIETRFNLRSPIYLETAAYGHMGRKTETVTKVFNKGRSNEKTVKVKLFPWEEENAVVAVRKAFKLK
jgi:S-adenosylmethionine synthetase